MQDIPAYISGRFEVSEPSSLSWAIEASLVPRPWLLPLTEGGGEVWSQDYIEASQLLHLHISRLSCCEVLRSYILGEDVAGLPNGSWFSDALMYTTLSNRAKSSALC